MVALVIKKKKRLSSEQALKVSKVICIFEALEFPEARVI